MRRVHVAVGVIRNPRGDVLLGRRHPGSHQGGLWEFPGGKVEAGEAVNEALARELREELGIAIGSSRPLLKVSHDYAEQAVLLDVWLVEDFRGEPRGQEGQALVWCAPRNLHRYRFPEANAAIVEACLTLQ